MLNLFKKKEVNVLQPCGIVRTVFPEVATSFDDVFLNAKAQLMIEVPNHRKPNRFHLNTLRKAS